MSGRLPAVHFEHWLSHPLSRIERRPLWTLFAITLFAAVVRFVHLGSPCIWADEAEVYMRTCGTYGQLLDQLRTDGFTPLHYEMHWVIGRVFGIKPTPIVLRLPSTICGIAMIPAVYFLARQLVDRSTSLLAALVTAGSAYLIYYSRDAKMYAETWLMVTLFGGCLFWWFRSRSLTAWLCWVAAATAGVAFHMTAAVVVGVSLLFVLSQSRLTWQSGLAWIAGVIVVMAGPAGYFGFFNQFTNRADDNWEKNSGLDWVSKVIQRWDPVAKKMVPKQGYDRWRQVGTAYVMGWEWTTDSYVPAPIKPDHFWRHPIKWVETEWTQTRTWVSQERYVLSADLIALILIAGMIPWPRRWRGVEGPIRPWRWQSLLWLLLWILVPVYAFHCISMLYFGLPSDLIKVAAGWIHLDKHAFGGSITIGSIAIIGLAIGMRFSRARRASSRALVTLVTAAVVVILLQVMGTVLRPLGAAAEEAGRGWHPLWVPRYMGFVVPAVFIAIAVLIKRLPTVYVRCTAVIVFIGINLLIGSGRIFGHTEPPTDQIAADEYGSAQAPDHHLLAWFKDPAGGIGPGGGNLDSEAGRYYVQQIAWRQPMSPEHFRHSTGDYSVEEGTPEFGIPRLVQRDKRITEVVVWDKFPDSGPPSKMPPAGSSEDPLLKKMPGWILQRDVWFPVRDFWTDRGDYRMRRRVYIKQ